MNNHENMNRQINIVVMEYRIGGYAWEIENALITVSFSQAHVPSRGDCFAPISDP